VSHDGPAEAAQASRTPEEALRASPSYAALSARMSQAPEGLGEKGFTVFTPTGLVLCSDGDGVVGRSLSPGAAALLRAPALGEWTVSRPLPDRRLGLTLDPELPRPVMFAGGPIRGGHGQVLACAVFFFAPQPEFYRLLAPPGAAELLAFRREGSPPEQSEGLRRARRVGSAAGLRRSERPAGPSGIPGEELKAGAAGRPRSSSGRRPDVPVGGQGLSGSDASGYRNLVGRPVVGTWVWASRAGDGARRRGGWTRCWPPCSLRSSFLLLLSVPALLMGFFFFVVDRRRTPRVRGGESSVPDSTSWIVRSDREGWGTCSWRPTPS
jgi:hypothetical protein